MVRSTGKLSSLLYKEKDNYPVGRDSLLAVREPMRP